MNEQTQKIKEKLRNIQKINKKIQDLTYIKHNEFDDEIKLDEIQDTWEKNDNIFDDILSTLEDIYDAIDILVDDIEELLNEA